VPSKALLKAAAVAWHLRTADRFGIYQRIKLGELASSMHIYPTYAIWVQQLAAELRLESLSASRTVKLARRLANLRRS
jgi:hypothetical protein